MGVILEGFPFLEPLGGLEWCSSQRFALRASGRPKNQCKGFRKGPLAITEIIPIVVIAINSIMFVASIINTTVDPHWGSRVVLGF